MGRIASWLTTALAAMAIVGMYGMATQTPSGACVDVHAHHAPFEQETDSTDLTSDLAVQEAHLAVMSTPTFHSDPPTSSNLIRIEIAPECLSLFATQMQPEPPDINVLSRWRT